MLQTEKFEKKKTSKTNLVQLVKAFLPRESSDPEQFPAEQES